MKPENLLCPCNTVLLYTKSVVAYFFLQTIIKKYYKHILMRFFVDNYTYND